MHFIQKIVSNMGIVTEANYRIANVNKTFNGNKTTIFSNQNTALGYTIQSNTYKTDLKGLIMY